MTRNAHSTHKLVHFKIYVCLSIVYKDKSRFNIQSQLCISPYANFYRYCLKLVTIMYLSIIAMLYIDIKT